jgi:OmpA-OmpF porin, OOP family
MKKILLLIVFVASTNFAFSQDKKNDGQNEETTDSITDGYSNDVVEKDYNKWSFEIGAGGNKPVEPFTKGYSSSNETNFFNIGKPDHFEAGIRYMLNTKFGVKLDGAYDKFSNLDSSTSLPFESNMIRLNFQGVFNVGRALNFEEFTSRFGLLLHGGMQASRFTPKTGGNSGLSEYNGGFIYGITPQFRITDRFVLHIDATLINNLRQHYTWDGITNQYFNTNVTEKNLNGTMFATSVGFTVYLGSHDKHADWYAAEPQQQNIQQVAQPAEEIDLSGITARLDELENCLLDNDKDGVNNCVDEEENSAPGAFVNTKGVTIEKPKDGINGLNGTTQIIKQEVKTEIRKGSLLNIFYDVNKDLPNAASAGDVSLIIGYMIANPESKIRLIGYADTRGGAEKNKALSQRRAKNLTDILVSKGISRDRVRFDGFGVDKRSANMSKEEMDYARRTEVIVE